MRTGPIDPHGDTRREVLGRWFERTPALQLWFRGFPPELQLDLIGNKPQFLIPVTNPKRRHPRERERPERFRGDKTLRPRFLVPQSELQAALLSCISQAPA